MKPEIKVLWLTALKSDEYKRGQGRLQSTSEETVKYCCLGVLCDIYNKETGKGEWRSRNIDRGEFVLESELTTIGLPVEIQNWAAIDGMYGKFSFLEEDNEKLRELLKFLPNRKTDLAILNDFSKRDDFSDVIPYIEKYF